MKNTRKILLSSLTMILVCCLLFVGTTYAWFSDSVVSNNNIITAGTLDVELEYSTDGTVWNDVEATTSILSADDRWEPGFTKVVYFKISNKGTLNFNYTFNMNVTLEYAGVNVYQQPFQLSDYLQYGSNVGTEQLSQLADRDAYAAAATNKLAPRNTLANKNLLEAGKVEYGWLVITMPTTVGNEANALPGTPAPSLEVGFDLLASQVNDNANGGEAAEPVANVIKLAYNPLLTSDDIYQRMGRDSVEPVQLETTYSFNTLDDALTAELSEYAMWHADFVVTFDQTVGAGMVGLAGQYTAFSEDWVILENSVGEFAAALDANAPIRLLDIYGICMNYAELCDIVKVFKCGAYDINNQCAGITMTVELRLYETYTEQECLEKFGYLSVNEETGNYIVVNSYTHTFTA